MFCGIFSRAWGETPVTNKLKVKLVYVDSSSLGGIFFYQKLLVGLYNKMSITYLYLYIHVCINKIE